MNPLHTTGVEVAVRVVWFRDVVNDAVPELLGKEGSRKDLQKGPL